MTVHELMAEARYLARAIEEREAEVKECTEAHTHWTQQAETALQNVHKMQGAVNIASFKLQELQGKAEASATKLKADQKATWDADAKSVSDAFDAAKAALTTNARAVKDKLAAIPAVLDKWEADLTALATPKKDEKKPAAKK